VPFGLPCGCESYIDGVFVCLVNVAESFTSGTHVGNRSGIVGLVLFPVDEGLHIA